MKAESLGPETKCSTSLTPTTAQKMSPHTAPMTYSRLTRFARQQTLKLMQQLQGCCLEIDDGNSQWLLGQTDAPLKAHLTLHDPSVWRDIAFGGTLAAAEAYMDGRWSCDNLTALVRIMATNVEQVNRQLDHPLKRFGAPITRLLHAFNRNTRQGARRNISAHYDLGNELFALFLDREHRMYSSAIYPSADASLEDASTYKLDRICQKLALSPSDHLLEIGTGWGGLALYAAQHYGCQVTTTTISREQYEHARTRVAEAGLEDRITLLFKDYRDLDGQFDKLVSIEMIEAVGHHYLPTYLQTLERHLKPDGLALIQAITVRDQRYRFALKEVDFIKKYIFPGGFLPSLTALLNQLTRHTALNLMHQEEIGVHYARTLRDWRERFEQQLDAVRQQGYDERFIRMWRYYLCYCEGGFQERAIGTSQLLLAMPDNRRAPLLGSLEAPLNHELQAPE